MTHALRPAVALALAFLAGAPTGAAPIPKDAGRAANDYHPLVVGTTWVYKIGDQEATVRVAAVERIGKEDCLRVETEVAGNVKTNEAYAVRPTGVYRVKVKDDVLTNPVKILPSPVKADASWEIGTSLGGQEIKGTMNVKGLREKVKTPAGEFEAVLVESSGAEVGGTKVQLRFWYARGVGMVREEIVLGEGTTITLELSKFTPGEGTGATKPKP